MTQEISSPIQAARVFGQAGGFPRQKHVFLAKFVVPDKSSANITNLTFAMKSIDRPKIQTKGELLNQYNKKRQIYTGYTIEPIRATLIDSRDGAAQNMWADYSRFYFGDFAPNPNYSYDITMPEINRGAFGFSAANGGANFEAVNAQFYFSKIEIYHFYDGVVDEYDLINPRITAFEPDDLDYANSEISTISMTLACEAVQYLQQRKVSISEFPEFASGSGRFWGRPLEVSSVGSSPFPANFSDALNDFGQSGGGFGGNGFNPLNTVNNNFRPVSKITGIINNFRSGNIRTASGSLAQFGNYSFGGMSGGGNLGARAFNNLSLADTLTLQNSAALYGINSQQYANAAAAIQGQSSNYGSGPTTFANGVSAGQQIDGIGASSNSNGLILSPAAYDSVNAQQSGSAQYGFNPQASQPGTGWGPTQNQLNQSTAAIEAQRAVTQEPLAPI